MGVHTYTVDCKCFFEKCIRYHGRNLELSSKESIKSLSMVLLQAKLAFDYLASQNLLFESLCTEIIMPVWLWLEEKKVPYKVKKVTMFCYGEKESWYKKICP